MGLDVYLQKCDDFDEMIRLEEEYEKRSEATWNSICKPIGQMSDDEKNKCREKNKKIAEELGLGEWGQYLKEKDIKKDSKKYPEHMFKIGYFRSSYNSGGINHVLNDYGMEDLYWIFQVGDDYHIFPDWDEALNRVNGLIKKIKEVMKDPLSQFWSLMELFKDMYEAYENGESFILDSIGFNYRMHWPFQFMPVHIVDVKLVANQDVLMERLKEKMKHLPENEYFPFIWDREDYVKDFFVEMEHKYADIVIDTSYITPDAMLRCALTDLKPHLEGE